MPTITASDFARLNEARRLQVERYRTAYFKREKALPADSDPRVNRQWLRVKLGTLDRCVPVGTLAAWSATFAESAPLSFDLAGPFVTVKRGTSSIKLFTLPVEYTDKGEGYACKSGYQPVILDKAIPLSVTPDNTLALELPDLGEELKALRAETTGNRRQVAREKAITKARKMVRDARERLEKANQEAAEAQAVIDSMTPAQAAALAREYLTARRLYNAALANPQTVPAWLPPTYETGCTKWDEVKQESTPLPPANSLEDYRQLAAALDLAQAALDAYKPRMHWPKWLSAKERKEKPEYATPVYGPAFDRLKEVEKKALGNLKWFIRSRFKDYCAAQCLPDMSSEYFDRHDNPRAYSRARLLLKAWPAQKADLESQVTEAQTGLDKAEAMPEK